MADAPPERGKADWKQTFKVGFIEQTFKRLCVRESLHHGEDTLKYMDRRDFRRLTTGKGLQDERRRRAQPSRRSRVLFTSWFRRSSRRRRRRGSSSRLLGREGRRLLGVWEWDGMADGMDHGSAPLYAIAMCDNNLKCRWAVVSLRLL